MATRDPPAFFEETRLNFEPASATYVVDVKLPSTANASRNRRQTNGSIRSNGDDGALRTRHLATASSIYHRKHHPYPKSFLWRVLEDNGILSLRTVDVCRPERAPDANLILNFHFPHAIRPSCIALSDPPDHDALTVFVLDEAGQLYTLLLRPDSFRKRSFVESGLGDACKIFTVNALQNFKTPYRLIAINTDQLIVALTDGGHIRLDKSKLNTASQPPWKETFYNAKGWVQGFKSILSSRGDYDTTAAAAAVGTSLGLDSASFLFTVCLDHRFRAWNLNSGQIIGTIDLLNATRDPHETGKWRLDPMQSNLIRIVGRIEGERTCVTYSPVGSGEFKFWTLKSDDGNSVDLNDMYPDAQFVPIPPLGSDVWTLADFCVAERHGSRGYQLWILWKNNIAYRVQELSFWTDELPNAWHNQWRSVYSDTTTPSAPVSGTSDSVDASERWLKLILSGRFPQSTLEAALRAYELAIDMDDSVRHSNRSIAESICSAIASTASLRKSSSGVLEYDQFRTSSETQWRKFYRILLEIDKPRGEALSFVYEPMSGMPSVVCADSISIIRECSKLEQIYHNPKSRHGENSDLSSLILTGQNFVEGFSDSMLQICQSVLRAELFEKTTKTDQERIQFFSDKAGFWRQISDEDCAQVTDVLGPNFNIVTNEIYEQLHRTFNQHWYSKRPTEYPLTEFGRKLIVKTTEDVAVLQWNVCFSQLILLVHMEFEFDRPEDALHNRVYIGQAYRDLLQALSRLQLIRWLADVRLPTPLSRTDRSNSTSGSSPVLGKRQGEEYQLNTALEESIGHLLGISDPGQGHPLEMNSIITKTATDLCAQDSTIEVQPHYIQCALLVRDRADLATELSPFCDDDPFSVYIQGRVALALRDHPSAAMHFKKAAYGMSIPQADPGRHSCGLLDDDEWNMLFAGMPRYYAHIVSLYEKYKAYSYVVDFARLALQFINTKTKDADLLRTEIQGRLFSGATAISRFELAHSTLITMKDRALQHSSLRFLIQRMCDNLHNAELVQLSFPGLQGAVDDVLAQKCHDTMDVITGVPYHQILYSWRIKRNDYRGAAVILMDRIQKLRQLGEGDQFTSDDVLDTVITRQYLMLINVLSCVEQKQAWITAEEVPYPQAASGKGAPVSGKRRVVTLADIRKEYQDELDRIAAIQNNQFGFAADDEMEIL
ncbi:nucleoporin Nup120/160-domain-containing protein [Xylaria bambusicola]|uniref:nucleoporin Nup120/160-domain-containing protein n=1 Tax=Xylaria bambusicola TaxID=326684 RepID=UPI002007E8FE|nr:nucleoporin Nup120/160-domain-containing protein [Xylaria bambusicola]KAI0526130.1 nucleoporin Nup120/160-domain-containing protein [Xylaria bambusicola]